MTICFFTFGKTWRITIFCGQRLTCSHHILQSPQWTPFALTRLAEVAVTAVRPDSPRLDHPRPDSLGPSHGRALAVNIGLTPPFPPYPEPQPRAPPPYPPPDLTPDACPMHDLVLNSTLCNARGLNS